MRQRNVLRHRAGTVGMYLALLVCIGLIAGCANYSGSIRSADEADKYESLDKDIDTKRFRLLAKPETFLLQWFQDKKKRQIVIPKEWLAPQEEKEKEKGNYVTSFNYSEEVTSFLIGDGRAGLHMSSYDSMARGSAQAGAGRDVFLVFDPQFCKVSKGLVDLGVTKKRVRYMGCFSAEFSHFLLADIDEDGLIDVGIIRESMKCYEYQDEFEMKEGIEGPIYEQSPVQWYVMRENQFRHQGIYDGSIPKRYSELPLIEMWMSPVDFAAYMTWESYDPAKWRRVSGERAAYMPTYRMKLIEEDRKEKL